MRKSLIILFSLISMSSCFNEGKTLGPFRFDKGCTDRVIPCGNWIYTYFLYKSWLRSYPKLEELKQGLFVDENKNLIRDDIDYFIDHILVENYDLWPDMYSIIRQYARVHGKYHDVKFSKSSGKYFLNNEYNSSRICLRSYYLSFDQYLLVKTILMQINYLVLKGADGGINKNQLLFLMYPRHNSPEKSNNYAGSSLDSIFNIPIHCQFKAVNHQEIFKIYKSKIPDWLFQRKLKKKVRKFESKHGKKHRDFYDVFIEK